MCAREATLFRLPSSDGTCLFAPCEVCLFLFFKNLHVLLSHNNFKLTTSSEGVRTFIISLLMSKIVLCFIQAIIMPTSVERCNKTTHLQASRCPNKAQVGDIYILLMEVSWLCWEGKDNTVNVGFLGKFCLERGINMWGAYGRHNCFLLAVLKIYISSFCNDGA